MSNPKSKLLDTISEIGVLFKALFPHILSPQTYECFDLLRYMRDEVLARSFNLIG